MSARPAGLQRWEAGALFTNSDFQMLNGAWLETPLSSPPAGPAIVLNGGRGRAGEGAPHGPDNPVPGRHLGPAEKWKLFNNASHQDVSAIRTVNAAGRVRSGGPACVLEWQSKSVFGVEEPTLAPESSQEGI